ncbi:unnamed protein product [Phytophthora fragariaefolia]|uniref:Unnamed protein product n=1 Tax=Phytophthora fragariaefolia TaxID=1490495 RepID=A0A9W6WQ81_9STRA|nr:unnamed protein product [Phytophthora fragariaefolia]
MSVVFKTKLRPGFIGPFKVVAKKGLTSSRDSDRAEPLAGEPAGQFDHGAQPVFAEFPRRDGRRPANTTLSAQEKPPGRQDHEGDPIVHEGLGPSPAAGTASRYHRNSDRHAGQCPGQELEVRSCSERSQSPTSPEDSVLTTRLPLPLLKEHGNRHYQNVGAVGTTSIW